VISIKSALNRYIALLIIINSYACRNKKNSLLTNNSKQHNLKLWKLDVKRDEGLRESEKIRKINKSFLKIN
jgi:hypothetical protein